MLHSVADANWFKFENFLFTDLYIQFFGKRPEISASIEEKNYCLTGVFLNYWEQSKAVLVESNILRFLC